MIKRSRPGRPLKGDQKRIRVSFTLHPHNVQWLLGEARNRRKSRSELLDEMCELLKKQGGGLPLPLSRGEIEDFCKTHHVRKLSLFGSVLTKDFRPESDVDVLVEFESDQVPSLFELVGMESELRQLFDGRKIDLKTPQELSRYFRDEVLQGSKVLYAA